MLTAWARRVFRVVIEPLARAFDRLGLTPNALTFVGLLLQACVGVLLALGYLPLGGLLLILFSAFDAIDGTLARLTGQVSRFGAFFDATIDRYAEALVLGGLLVYVMTSGAEIQVYLIYAAIVGSLLVSYTRAKAESLGIACTEGMLTRAERVAVLIIGLVLNTWQPLAFLPNALTLALWILAVLSNVTAIQRVWAVWRATKSDRTSAEYR